MTMLRGAALTVVLLLLAWAPAQAAPKKERPPEPIHDSASVFWVSPDGSRTVFVTGRALLPADRDEDQDLYEYRNGRLRLIPLGRGRSFYETEGVASGGRYTTFKTTVGSKDQIMQLLVYDGTGLRVLASARRSPCEGTYCDLYTRPATGAAGSVFVYTRFRLSPQDQDQSVDLYEASLTRAAPRLLTGGARDGGDDSQDVGSVKPTAGSTHYFLTREPLAAEDLDGADDLYSSGPEGVRLLSGGVEFDEVGMDLVLAGVSDDGSRTYLATRERMPEAPDRFEERLYRFEGTARQLMGEFGVTSEYGGVTELDPAGHRLLVSTTGRLSPADGEGSPDLNLLAPNGPEWISTGPRSALGGSSVEFERELPNRGFLFSTDRQLVFDDEDDQEDVYLRKDGATSMLGRDHLGRALAGATAVADSADENALVLASRAHLTRDDADGPGNLDFFLVRARGSELISRGVPGFDKYRRRGDRWVGFPEVTVRKAGTRFVFTTSASLLPEDGDGRADVYMRDLGRKLPVLVSEGPLRIRSGRSNGPSSYSFRIVTRGISERSEVACWLDRRRLRRCDRWLRFDSLAKGKHELVARAKRLRPDGRPLVLARKFKVSRPGGNRGREDESMRAVAISDDGSRAVFQADRRLSAKDRDESMDTYVRDPRGLRLVTPRTQEAAEVRGISMDARTIVFSTRERVIGPDDDDAKDYLLWRPAGLSAFPGLDRLPPTRMRFGGISRDGRVRLVVTRSSLDPVDRDAYSDAYLVEGGSARLVSPGRPGGPPADITPTGISADGTTAFFTTIESLVPEDRDEGETLYASNGQPVPLTPTRTSAPGFEPRIVWGGSGGRGILFRTQAPLLPSDSDPHQDMYRWTGSQLEHISIGLSGGNGDFGVSGPYRGPRWSVEASPDGERVLFQTNESLLPGDADSKADFYMWDRGELSLPLFGEVPERATLDFSAASLGFEARVFSTRESRGSSSLRAKWELYVVTDRGEMRITPPGRGREDAWHAPIAVAPSGRFVAYVSKRDIAPGDRDDGGRDLYAWDGRRTIWLTRSVDAAQNEEADRLNAVGSPHAKALLFSTEMELSQRDEDDTRDVYSWKSGVLRLVSAP